MQLALGEDMLVAYVVRLSNHLGTNGVEAVGKVNKVLSHSYVLAIGTPSVPANATLCVVQTLVAVGGTGNVPTFVAAVLYKKDRFINLNY